MLSRVVSCLFVLVLTVPALHPQTAAAGAAREAKPLPAVGFGDAGISSQSIEIRLHGGRSLVLRGVNEAQLGRLMRLVEALPC